MPKIQATPVPWSEVKRARDSKALAKVSAASSLLV